MMKPIRNTLSSVLFLCVFAYSATVAADPIPEGWQAWNVEPIGFRDYDDRYSGKLTIKEHDGTWYLYQAYSKKGDLPPALVITDVTDPTNPTLIKQIDYPMDGNMSQVTLHGDTLVTGLARQLTKYDTTHAINFMSEFQPDEPAPDKLKDEGIIIWDVSNPTEPVELSRWETGAYGTHRNIHAGGKHLFLSASAPGYRAQILRILDISDRKNPVEVGRWAQFGQRKGEIRQDGVIPSFHGPAIISEDGNTAVLGFTPDMVSLDISDISNPKVIGRLQITPPFVNNVTQSVHSVIPYWDEELVYVVGEPKIEQCGESLSANIMVQNADPTKPYMISVFPTPKPPEGFGWDNFCDRPGRFGPHNTNNEIHNEDVKQPDEIIHLAYFNAGIRVFDISEPRLPAEVGWFLPADPETPKRSQSGLLPISISQEVLIDTRGNIFVSESSGLYVLRNSDELAER
ncbi:MAG: LVIVD repeat-containing protein [Woeseiaceae bacterium]